MTAILRTILGCLGLAMLIVAGCADPDDDRPALTLTGLSSAGFAYTADLPEFSGWHRQHIGPRRRLCDGMFVLSINGSDGRDMEWSPVDRTPRNWHNLATGYSGLHRPATGTPCEIWIRSIDGRLQTQPVAFRFP